MEPSDGRRRHSKTRDLHWNHETTGTTNDETHAPSPTNQPPQPHQHHSTTTSTTTTTMMEHRMTELFVLAGGGTKPFWNTNTNNTTVDRQSTSSSSTSRIEHHDQPHVTTTPMSISKLLRIVTYVWMISVSYKVLLFPAYRSTDFNVHRHWKALTYRPNPTTTTTTTDRRSHRNRILPILHWYANNTVIPVTTTDRSTTRRSTTTKSVETVHTLDYPPGFAWLEYSMVNNILVRRLLFRNDHQNIIDTQQQQQYAPQPDRCLDIMDDRTMDRTRSRPNDGVMTNQCIYYMRSTVIVFADILYWCGAAVVALLFFVYHENVFPTLPRSHPSQDERTQSSSSSRTITTTTMNTASCFLVFAFLTFHPTLLWLDHVHFQYNGTMLGLLLISIGLLLHGNNNTKNNNHNSMRYPEHMCHILAIVVFSLLLTLKHLYLTNSLWYMVYVLRRYCMIRTTANHPNQRTTHPTSNISESTGPQTTLLRLQWLRLCCVVISGSIAIVLPFIPFLIAIYYDDTNTALLWNGSTTTITYLEKVQAWLLQLKQRLFPFQRGLVHTYWAGNVWAIYVAMYKVVTYTARYMPHLEEALIGRIPSPDAITPKISAIAMVLAQLPGLVMAWWAAVHKCNVRLLQSFTIVSLGTFLFQYHAHEKAIVTSLLPCIVWYAVIRYGNVSTDHSKYQSLSPSDQIRTAGSIMFDMNAYSILGLYPLLYSSQELLLKVSSTILYLSLLWVWCSSYCSTSINNGSNNPSVGSWSMPFRNWLTVTIVLLTIVQLEIPYRWLWGKYEFMPLAVTSIVCAFGYATIYIRLIYF